MWSFEEDSFDRFRQPKCLFYWHLAPPVNELPASVCEDRRVSSDHPSRNGCVNQKLLDVIPIGVREAETRRDLVFEAAGRVGASMFFNNLHSEILERAPSRLDYS